MTERTEFEAIVLGGGPAGIAAATLLARRSHRVALVRPSNTPAGALAESIPPSARRLLSELGVLDSVERAGFEPNLGNTVWWAGQDVRQERFAEGETGFHVDRASLERVLVEAAESIGVTVLQGMSARTAEQDQDMWTVACEGPDEGSLELRAPWVVDATGRHGLLARTYREPDRSTTTLALVRSYGRPDGWDADIQGHTLVESFEDGWACSIPLSPTVRCVVAMIDQRHAELEGHEVTTMFDGELAKARHIAATTNGAVPTGEAWACPASLHSATRYGRHGLLLAGDAGSCLDPLSSYGVKKALASGWLAGITVHSALIDEDVAEAAIAFFEARERDVYTRFRARSATFFETAHAFHGHGYWSSRAQAARTAGGSATEVDPDEASPDDIEKLIDTPVARGAVEAAYDDLRAHDRLDAVRGTTLRTLERAAIRGHRIVMATHFASDAFPEGIRYAFNVDLGALMELAPKHDDVAELWTAYNAASPPVPLPDFLTGLSTAFAAGLLEHRGE